MLEQFHPTEVLGLAAAAEANGFDGVMAADHFQPWTPRQGEASFVWNVLSALGQTTDGDLGTGLGPAVRVDDRAEQQQLGAGEAVADLDMALRDVGDEARLGLAEQQRRGQSEDEGGEALHSICTV